MAVTGRGIKKLRGEAQLTQKKLAELVGISQAHIAKIEQEKVDPRLSTVNRILQVLRKGNGKKCRDIMTKGVFIARPNENILKISEVMVRNAVSQLPVLDGKKIVGTVTEECIIRNLAKISEKKVKNIMEPPLPVVSEDTGIDLVHGILEMKPGVLVIRQRQLVGIMTRSDLLKTIE